MNFEQALSELKNGKRVRRKAWEPLMHLYIYDGKVKAFKGEHSNFYGDANIILSQEWLIVNGDGKKLDFVQAIEALKAKKHLTNPKWNDNLKFIFVDGENLAICKPVEFDFMPGFKCFCANDWEILR